MEILDPTVFVSELIDENLIVIFDHDLGGGTTLYRKRQIAEFVVNQLPVLLVLSKDRVKEKAIQLISYNGVKETYSSFLDFDRVFTELTKLKPKSIFVNSIVTFRPFIAHIKALNCYLNGQAHADIKVAIHDFYPICPSFNLLDYKWNYCGVPQESVCVECRSRHRSGSLKEPEVVHWREYWDGIFKLCSEILVFSHSSKEIMLKAFPSITDNLIVKEHSMSYFKPKETFKWSPKPIRIGILGNIYKAKGAEVVDSLSDYLYENSPQTEICIFGRYGGNTTNNNLHVIGEYTLDDLQGLVEQRGITVFLMPSICPETFSYTTHELVLMQYPVVAFNLGAQAEKIASYEKGLLVESSVSPGVLYKALQSISA
jgi:glycosyltransferase involved in cell wall biosynthesis